MANVTAKDISNLTDTLAAAQDRVSTLENSLRSITALWPDPGMWAEIDPKYVGPNDGRMRADLLFAALNMARKALELPTYPEPEHWKKVTRSYPDSNAQSEFIRVTVPENDRED